MAVAEFAAVRGLPVLGSLLPLRRDALGFFTRVLEERGDRVRMRVPGSTILGLAEALSRFRFELVTQHTVTPSAWITLRPNRPIHLRLSRA